MTHYTTFYNLFKDLLSIKPTKKHLAKYLEVKAQIWEDEKSAKQKISS